MIFSVATACSSRNSEPTILDVAEIFSQNSADFEAIRERFSGPFPEFSRVPDRHPEKQNKADNAFLKELRRKFDVEYIDLFPLGDGGLDEIDVVIKRYGLHEQWTVVSLVYTDLPLPDPDPETGQILFDKCDQRALDWLAIDHEASPAAAFCRITDNWYAYQSVL